MQAVAYYHFYQQEGWLSPTEHASVFAHFGLPGYAPGTITVNVTWMERGLNPGQTLIYLQPFTSYSKILVGNCNFFLPLAFNAPVVVFPLEFREKVWSSEN